MGKTPEYTRRAIDKYTSGKERLSLLLPEGTKAAIEAKRGKVSYNAYILELIRKDLDGSSQAKIVPENANAASLEELQRKLAKKEESAKRIAADEERQKKEESDELKAFFNEKMKSLTDEQKSEVMRQLEKSRLNMDGLTD